jgi:CNT family concentrative nucleoside transporter
LTYDLDSLRPVGAILLILLICWLLSENKKRFPFLLAFGAIAMQAALVLLVFALPNARPVVNGIGAVVGGLADATSHGSQFIFGFLGGGDQPYAIAEGKEAPFIFGFRILPIILVVCALAALLWHWGVLKALTRFFGLIFERTMGLSGALALAVASNIIMGMVESSMVVRGYLTKFTRSELFVIMGVGLANVSGSTMVAYALILNDVLPNAAGHVLVASIISAPAGVLLARILIPEPGPMPKSDYKSDLKYNSSMDAISRGVQDGTMVAVNVAAMLIVFVSIVWLVNGILTAFPPVNGEPLTLQRILGFVFAPVAYMIGIPWAEADTGGNILGTKLFLTEFVAFIELGAVPVTEISERTRMLLTYAVCGFANVASVGILSGGLSVLVPERREEILGLAWKALIPGFLATLMTASVVALMPPYMFK